MSIWTTILDLQPVQEVGYGPSDTVLPDSDIQLASAVPWYGGDGLRVSIGQNWDAECVINREQIIQLRDALSVFLEATDAVNSPE